MIAVTGIIDIDMVAMFIVGDHTQKRCFRVLLFVKSHVTRTVSSTVVFDLTLMYSCVVFSPPPIRCKTARLFS